MSKEQNVVETPIADAKAIRRIKKIIEKDVNHWKANQDWLTSFMMENNITPPKRDIADDEDQNTRFSLTRSR